MREKVAVFAASVALLVILGTASAQAATLPVHVLSDRANLTSGGDALVSIDLPRTVPASSVKVTVGSADVTSQFAVRPNHSYEGLVTGLANGANVLKAEAPGGLSGQTTIVNHPIGGPVLSGPQIQPWVCRNPGATDSQCDAPTTYAYEYKSSLTGALETYDPTNPPSDIESTTT